MTPRRGSVALLAALFALGAPVSGQQACLAGDPLYRLDGDDLVWSDVRAVSSNDSLLVVLTESYPAVHLFDLVAGIRRGSWGQSGDGPGEFRESTGIALLGHYVYVLDGNQGRLSIFDFTGDVVRTVNLRDFGMASHYPRWLNRGLDTVLFELAVPMGNERAIVAWSLASGNLESARPDTVIVYPQTTATKLRLTAPGAPGYTLPPPYWPTPEWTPFSGGVAFWQEPETEVRILGFDGELRSTVPLPFDDRIEVAADDREFWFQNAIPTELFGQRVFEPLRAEARRTVEFPRYHPLVFQLLGAPDDRLWVRRTPDGRDQIWEVVDAQGQLADRVSLSPRQALMAVIPDHLIVKATDDLGVESVEVRRCGHPQRSPSPAVDMETPNIVQRFP